MWGGGLSSCQGGTARVGEGLKRGQCCCLTSGDCQRGSCLPSICPRASHFTFSPSPHMPLVPFQVLPRSWIPAGVYLSEFEVHCGPFKRSLLRILQCLPLPQPPLVFAARSYGDLSSWHWTLGWVVGSGARILHSQGIPPNFYLPHVNVGLLIPPPLLPVWIDVAS